ncbi:hypothetical protein [Streptomyces platensis]|uniref:hypothetical protein n=1 Tax=Streptomyces platensis TaxID=58346 RepID=UPI003862FFE6|nr:hypothetical protein OG962_03510 [Streptomyces platensis]
MPARTLLTKPHGRTVPGVPRWAARTAFAITHAMAMSALGLKITGEPEGMAAHGWQVVAFWIAYLPLTAWGPLLGLLTVHYYRRRRSAPGGQVDVGTRPPLRPITRRAGTDGPSRPLP